jgi:iron complex transport system ATP-binding protein
MPAVQARAASVRRGEVKALIGLDWTVAPGDRWVVLGPNGSGKTSLLSLLCGYLHPLSGTVEVLGERLGRVDVRRLRERIGLSSAEVAKQLRPGVTAAEAVLAGRHGALETWWHEYPPAKRTRAAELLAAGGLAERADHSFRTLSEGERQQVLLARALMAEPELMLLDEPNAGLDVGARERLLRRLTQLAGPGEIPMVLVTHHVEEIPVGFTHCLLLRAGQTVANGPIEEVLDSESLSDCFGLALRVVHHGPRYGCHAVE